MGTAVAFVGATPVADEEIGDRGDDFVGEAEAEAETVETPLKTEEILPETVEKAEKVEEKAEKVEESVEETVEDVQEVEEKAEIEPETVETEEKTAKKAAPRIPKARFDAVNERMQRAEAALKALREQRAALPNSTPPDFDFDAAEQKYADAVVAGQMEDAKKVRAEIRAAERLVAEASIADQAMATYEGVAARASVDAAVALVNVEYPVFDPKSDVYDQAMVDEALELFNGLMLTGKSTPAEALVRAAKATAALRGVQRSEVEVPVAPVAAKPEVPVKKKEEVKPVKKEEVSLDAKMKMAEKHPPSLSAAGNAGVSAPSFDVLKLSDKEWDKLSETDIAKLRGDFL